MSANAQASTGIRNAALVAWKTALTGGTLKIYSGAIPASADAAVTGTLICTVTGPSSAGLQFDTTPVSGVLSKSPTQAWAGITIGAGGLASYFRVVGASDSGTLSTTEARLQGTVGVAGEGLNLTGGATLATSATNTVDSFAVEVPTF